MPPSQIAAAMNGSGTTHSGLRLIQKQPSPNSTTQTAMKIPTAQPGAISPAARKKGAMASIAARATTPTTYLAPVRVSRGMAASSHFRVALSGDRFGILWRRRPESDLAECGPHDKIKSRAWIGVVMPSGPMEYEPLETGRDCGAGGERICAPSWTRAGKAVAVIGSRPRVRLVSHDMGSISGFAMCLDHPDRVKHHVALGVPPPFIKLNLHILPAMKHLWFQQALAMPGLGARLVSAQQQRLPRYLFHHFTVDPASSSSDDIDTYIARLQEPKRARGLGAVPASGSAGNVAPRAWRLQTYPSTNADLAHLSVPTIPRFLLP
jgi:hypothetical protein